MNELIETIFKDFPVPVSFLYYEGNADTYVTYQQTDAESVLTADNELQNFVDFYDVDIYSRGNYLKIMQDIIDLMTSNGFSWCPSRSSGDLYETDTKIFHKTLCFSIERGDINGEDRS